MVQEKHLKQVKQGLALCLVSVLASAVTAYIMARYYHAQMEAEVKVAREKLLKDAEEIRDALRKTYGQAPTGR